MAKFVYVGEHFYQQSGTMLGVLYTEGDWQRCSWNTITGVLSQDICVHIRPADESELLRMYRLLDEYKAARAKRAAESENDEHRG